MFKINSLKIEYKIFNNHNFIYATATAEGVNHLLGTIECSLTENKGVFYFNRLFVHKDYRRQGIGTKLLLSMLQTIKERNVVLELDINPYGDMSYEQLEKFYIKHGFSKQQIDDEILGTYHKFFFNAFMEV